MSVQQERNSAKTEAKCKSCALFYGSENTDGLCSSCYKKQKNSKKEEISVILPAKSLTPQESCTVIVESKIEKLTIQEGKTEQKDRKRCHRCSKKTGLLGHECKCGYSFCSVHRLPQQHTCEFNHEQVGRDLLKKQIFKVYNGKIQHV